MSDRALARIGGWCGVVGPLALAVYFGAPALTGWPYAGAAPADLAQYALAHQMLFFAGAWFQVTGTLLSVVFFLAIVQLAGATARLAGLLVVVAATALLSLVLVEAALLVAVPIAAATGDLATVATTFALSNGPFARVFPLAPSSVTYVALGVVILGSTVVGRRFGQVALAIGIAFELTGMLAIVSPVGLIAAIALSAGQALWILAAAAALLRRNG